MHWNRAWKVSGAESIEWSNQIGGRSVAEDLAVVLHTWVILSMRGFFRIFSGNAFPGKCFVTGDLNLMIRGSWYHRASMGRSLTCEIQLRPLPFDSPSRLEMRTLWITEDPGTDFRENP